MGGGNLLIPRQLHTNVLKNILFPPKFYASRMHLGDTVFFRKRRTLLAIGLLIFVDEQTYFLQTIFNF